MKKKFFTAFFGLIFCLFVGSLSASAVETKSSSLTLTSNTTLLSSPSIQAKSVNSRLSLYDNYPIRRITHFTLSPGEYAEFFYKFNVSEDGKFGFEWLIGSHNPDNPDAYTRLKVEESAYIPHIDPEEGHFGPYTGLNVVGGRNPSIKGRGNYDYTNLLSNGEGWWRIKITNELSDINETPVQFGIQFTHQWEFFSWAMVRDYYK